MKHVVSIDDFTLEELSEIFSLTDRIIENPQEYRHALEGKSLVTLFWEPSTRTRMSFVRAAQELGMMVDSNFDPETSSVAKGETVADTIRNVCGYDVSAIVMRHKNAGAAFEAAKYAGAYGTVIINGGDGSHEHPTQTMLDLYTMIKEVGQLDGKNVVLCGDLKNGRTVHSLIKALARFKANISLVAPSRLQMPDEYITQLGKMGVEVSRFDSLDSVIERTDILYVTRIQRERFAKDEEELYEKVAGTYQVNMALVSRMREKSAIMHPLPRVTEISPDVDKDHRAAYFRQSQNGYYIRKGLLVHILSERRKA